MRSALLQFIQDLRASYWFLPSLMVFAAFVLAYATHAIDIRLDPSIMRGFGPLSVAEPTGARAILTTIAGSIIGVAGVTFSITIATVSFASGNYGPRLIGNFMRDRGNQVTLGVFIGTFVYCLLVLGTVRDASGVEDGYEVFVPYLSLLVTLMLAILSIAMLIYFFHHVPESIDIQHLTTEIGRELREDVRRLFPNDYDGEEPAHGVPEAFDVACAGRQRRRVTAGKDGYITTIAVRQIEEIAAEKDLLIDLQYRPGDFITREDVLMDVYTNKDDPLSEDALARLQGTFSVGQQRTPEQNVLFLVDTLVEIAARALSPGINDPQTAIACFDWLRAGANGFGKKENEDSTSPLRVRISEVTFADFIDRAFRRSRPYAAADRNAALHLVTVLTEIAAFLPEGERRDLVIKELRMLRDETLALNPNARWAGEFQERFNEAEAALASGDAREALRNTPNWFGGRG
ncbi:DUF2254 domain-containing protein [Parvularcula lutaonensis]|uniref:DUF2254 domain-containing protein n=1 Tax=Parvularcula lutaonensis TaxID=491923 RepID=A0ABV7MD01_9PROT|nr:DUF2254 domain-containing protein [Parvularcula lutaonensis]GGY51952.1 hypothetical protein GCM10007148_21140 [Parvularcula lutaonensis]